VADDTRNEVGGKMADVVYLADVRVRKLLRRIGEIAERLDYADLFCDDEGVRRYTLWLHAELLRLDEARLEAETVALLTKASS